MKRIFPVEDKVKFGCNELEKNSKKNLFPCRELKCLRY